MTVEKLKPKKDSMCPYCGLVSAAKHPNYTCPRVASAEWDHQGGKVEFIDPFLWETLKSKVTEG